MRSFWFRDYFGIIQNVIEIHESIFKNDIIETFIKFLFTNFKSLKSNFELNVDIHTVMDIKDWTLHRAIDVKVP